MVVERGAFYFEAGEQFDGENRVVEMSFLNTEKNPASTSFIADAVGNLKKMENQVMGPELDFSAAIPKPAELGVGTRGTMGQMMTNMTATSAYVDVLAFGNIGPGTDVVSRLPFGPGGRFKRDKGGLIQPLGVR